MIPETHRRHLSLRARRRSFVLSEAALLGIAAAAVWVVLAWLETFVPLKPEELLRWTGACGVSTAFLSLACVFSLLGWRGVVPLTLLGWAAWGIPLAVHAARAPSVAFLSFAWAALVTTVVLRMGISNRRGAVTAGDAPGALWAPSVILSSVLGLSLAALGTGYRLTLTTTGQVAVLSVLLVPALLATLAEISLVRRGELAPWKSILLASLTLGACALFAFPEIPRGRGIAHLALALRVVAACAGASLAHETHDEVAKFLWKRPALLVVLTFVVLCGAGGLVLKFPVCTTRPIALIDALFTSVSAACVTGLIVLDTPVDFTVTGQVVIVLLIQIGGLGIMALSAFATLFLGRSFGSRAEQGLGEVVGSATPRGTVRMVRAIVLSTLIIEGLGAILLIPAFLVEGVPLGEAVWKSVFHAVSAFCNAGFALQSDNLMSYKSNPVILHVISGLIVLGGLGFGVLMAVYDLASGRKTKLDLHAKLTLSSTAILIVAAGLLFLVLEWNLSLTGYSFFEKLNNAWLQGITYRTAGFNSVDFARIGPATVYLAMIFMFVGASPSSTGGGIKTTTAAVLLLAVRTVLTRRRDVEAFGRRITVDTVFRAAAVAALSAAFVATGTAVLLQSQMIPFHSLCFEAFSAFGTVGLSLGATTSLDALGKIVIMGLMFAGRTGPLTMVVLLLQVPRRQIRYTAEEVLVG